MPQASSCAGKPLEESRALTQGGPAPDDSAASGWRKAPRAVKTSALTVCTCHCGNQPAATTPAAMASDSHRDSKCRQTAPTRGRHTAVRPKSHSMPESNFLGISLAAKASPANRSNGCLDAGGLQMRYPPSSTTPPCAARPPLETHAPLGKTRLTTRLGIGRVGMLDPISASQVAHWGPEFETWRYRGTCQHGEKTEHI
jgi:hypothetical protein